MKKVIKIFPIVLFCFVSFFYVNNINVAESNKIGGHVCDGYSGNWGYDFIIQDCPNLDPGDQFGFDGACPFEYQEVSCQFDCGYGITVTVLPEVMYGYFPDNLAISCTNEPQKIPVDINILNTSANGNTVSGTANVSAGGYYTITRRPKSGENAFVISYNYELHNTMYLDDGSDYSNGPNQEYIPPQPVSKPLSFNAYSYNINDDEGDRPTDFYVLHINNVSPGDYEACWFADSVYDDDLMCTEVGTSSPPAGCGEYCGGGGSCQGDLQCSNNICINPSCPKDPSCLCQPSINEFNIRGVKNVSGGMNIVYNYDQLMKNNEARWIVDNIDNFYLSWNTTNINLFTNGQCTLDSRFDDDNEFDDFPVDNNHNNFPVSPGDFDEGNPYTVRYTLECANNMGSTSSTLILPIKPSLKIEVENMGAVGLDPPYPEQTPVKLINNIIGIRPSMASSCSISAINYVNSMFYPPHYYIIDENNKFQLSSAEDEIITQTCTGISIVGCGESKDIIIQDGTRLVLKCGAFLSEYIVRENVGVEYDNPILNIVHNVFPNTIIHNMNNILPFWDTWQKGNNENKTGIASCLDGSGYCYIDHDGTAENRWYIAPQRLGFDWTDTSGISEVSICISDSGSLCDLDEYEKEFDDPQPADVQQANTNLIANNEHIFNGFIRKLGSSIIRSRARDATLAKNPKVESRILNLDWIFPIQTEYNISKEAINIEGVDFYNDDIIIGINAEDEHSGMWQIPYFAERVNDNDLPSDLSDLEDNYPDIIWDGSEFVNKSDVHKTFHANGIVENTTPINIGGQGDGVYALKYALADRAGNAKNLFEFFVLDTTPPISETNLSQECIEGDDPNCDFGPSGQNGWYNAQDLQNIDIRILAQDANHNTVYASGVQAKEINLTSLCNQPCLNPDTINGKYICENGKWQPRDPNETCEPRSTALVDENEDGINIVRPVFCNGDNCEVYN